MSDCPKSEKSKSILDNVPVNDNAFPLSRGEGELLDTPQVKAGLVVVSSCPHCGSPIYGPYSVSAKDPVDPANVRFSCACHQTRQRSLPMETK